MKRLVLITFFNLFLIIAYGQDFSWGKAAGSTGSDYATSAYVDEYGAVYTVGTFVGTVDFDPGAGVSNQTSAGGSDGFIQKLDANGNFVFAYRFGDLGTEVAYDVTVIPNGQIYITGFFTNTVDFNSGLGTAIYSSNGLQDIYVLALNNDGTFLSVLAVGGPSSDYGLTINANSGALSIGGTFQGTVDFNQTAGVANLTTAGTSGYLARYVISGSVMTHSWSYIQGSSVNGSAMDASGNIYTTGNYSGTFDFNFGGGVNNLTSAGGADAFVSKVSATGAYGFAKSFGGATSDAGISLKFDASGNLYNGGYFTGTADFDPSASTSNLISAGLNDSYVTKLDASGNLIWTKGYGGTGDDRTTAVDYDAVGNVYATGYFSNTVDFDPGAGTASLTSAGGLDGYVSKFSSTGQYIWANSLGSTADDAVNDLNTSSTAGIYFSGYQGGTIDVNPTATTTNLTNAGSRDVMTVKWLPCTILPVVANTTPVSNLTICQGNSTILSASGLGTIGWYTAATGGTYLGGGATLATGVINTNTSFYVQDSTCTACTRIQVNVQVQPPIANQTIAGSVASVCVGQSATITVASSETGNQYYLRNDADNSIIAGPTAGTGSAINFSTGPVNSTTTYNVNAIAQPSNFALDLDGTNDYINLGTGNRNITNAITVSAKMRTTVTGTSQFIVDKYLSAGIGYYLLVDATGKASFQGRDIAGPIKSSGLSTTMVADNQWHEITGVLRNTGWEIWVDGVMENSGTYSIGATGLGTTAGLLVGQFNSTYSPVDIDRLAIWNASLSPATIALNATSCLTGGEANLVAYFTFNEGSGSTVTDLSPSATNGSLVNMTAPACWINGSATECASSCQLEMGNTVTVNTIASPSQPTISASGSTMLCSGGSVTLTSSAGTSYLWSNGATTPSITVSTAGTYTVQVTNAAGCQSVASAGTTVIVGTLPSQPTISAGGPTTFCAGGSVTLTSSAGTSYLWSNGATTASISPTTAGTYTIQVTNASGCQSVASAGTTVTVNALPSQPTISAGGSTAFCSGGSVTLTSSAGTSYLWSNGATTASISPTTAGTYSVQVTNAAGCQSVASAGTAVTVNTLPSQPTISAGGSTTFCAGGSVTLTSSAGTSYLWSNGATTASISPTTAGTYTVQVTNAAGCQSVASAGTAVTVNALPSQPTISAGGSTTFCAGGSVTLTSSAGTSYLWSNGATTTSISPTTAGTYTVQVTNAFGCQSVASAGTTVTVNALPSQPTITAGGPTTFCSGGSVTLTSSAGSSYLWSDGSLSSSINPSSSGTYSVQVTNAAGCQSVASASTVVTVNSAPSQPTITAGGATTFCAGGSVTLTSSAGTSYLWSTGATTASISPTTAGTYTVQVTNAAGCQSTASNATTVIVNTLPVIAQGTVTNPTSCTIDNGSVEITGSGTGDISWNGTSSGNLTGITLPVTISGLSDGSFNITFTNASGCLSNTINSSLTAPSAPAAPTITPTGTTTFCAGGSVTLTSSNGAGYLWSNGETTASIQVSDAGSYTVSITDASGCSSASSAGTAVTVNALPVIATGTITNPSSCTVDNGSIEVTGTGTGDLSWTGTASGSSTAITLPSTIGSLGDGSYDITFTDALGCTSLPLNSSLSLPGTPSAPTISASGALTFCEGGSVTLTSSTGTSYLWSNGETTASIDVVADGTYTVIITNVDGCTSPASSTTTVAVDQQPNVSVTEVNNTITATQNGATYQWIDCGNGNQSIAGATGISFSPTVNGSYAVVITSGTCSDTSVCTVISTIGLSEQTSVTIGVHPNPGFDVVKVTANGEIQHIEIYAATGELIRSEQDATFDISNMARGIYLLKVTTNQGTGMVRLVKE